MTATIETPRTTARIELRLLGPLRLGCGTEDITPTPTKMKQLVAMLAFNANAATSVSSLIDGLWEGHPPNSARGTLHTYITTLRRTLEATLPSRSRLEARDIVVTQGASYVLAVEPGATDLGRYRERVRTGLAALKEGSLAAGTRLIREGLAEWRGEPIADVALTETLDAEVLRLRESRLYALEQCLQAELRLGWHAKCLEELALLCKRNPLHEGFHRQRMIALNRSGRRAEALRVFEQLEAVLQEELEIEPDSTSLQVRDLIYAGRA
ncbi:AfsR/SARP family transcriptional regulator [Amycolatopsis sp. NPDC021455]|uniref:AfsR/SARP family transcriptional regulator n=1 Tax=Amycolatopsis sp. NPDC021455 TaxID=3154901 RepID=UPI0033FFC835